MSQFALTKPLKNHDPICDDLIAMAERELAAFFKAVTELLGSEQALLSAEDWLQESTAINMDDLRNNDLHASTRQWRELTVKAAARLASRVNASFTLTASRTPAYSD
jgi:anti-sigma-K factor RskA